jgi:hypothetical protein
MFRMSPTRVRSIVAQGDHGIDAHSSSCLNNAGNNRSEQEDGGDDAQDSRVSHADLRPLVHGVVEADAEASAQKKANARGPSDGRECKASTLRRGAPRAMRIPISRVAVRLCKR